MNSSKIHYIRFLCERLGPYLKKKDPCFRIYVPVKEMIAMSLHKLGSADGLQRIRNLYGVHKRMLSNIIRFFIEFLRSNFN